MIFTLLSWLLIAPCNTAQADQYNPVDEIHWDKIRESGTGCPNGSRTFSYQPTFAGLGVIEMQLDPMELGTSHDLVCEVHFPYKVPPGKRLSMRAVWAIGKTRFDVAEQEVTWVIKAGRVTADSSVQAVLTPGHILPQRSRTSLQLKDAALSKCGDDSEMVTQFHIQSPDTPSKVDRVKWILTIEDCE